MYEESEKIRKLMNENSVRQLGFEVAPKFTSKPTFYYDLAKFTCNDKKSTYKPPKWFSDITKKLWDRNIMKELIIDGDGQITFRKNDDGSVSIEIFKQNTLIETIDEDDKNRLIEWLRE